MKNRWLVTLLGCALLVGMGVLSAMAGGLRAERQLVSGLAPSTLLQRAVAAQSSAAPIVGDYSGSVDLAVTVGSVFSDTLATPTTPAPGTPEPPELGSIDLSLHISQSGASLTGYVTLDKTLVFSAEHTVQDGATTIGIGPYLSGALDGSNITLQSEKVALLINGQTIYRQFQLTGVISETIDSNRLSGEYRETLWGYTRAPITVIGSFNLSQPRFDTFVAEPANTATPTPTVTATVTATATATSTTAPSATPTPTATATETATATPSATLEPNSTATATNTPTETATETAIPVDTPTATETPIPTATVVETATATEVATATPTIAPTATAPPIPTATIVETAMATATEMATATPTIAPTATATLIPTATVVEIATATTMPTATTTSTPTSTMLPVDTATPTVTSTPTAPTSVATVELQPEQSANVTYALSLGGSVALTVPVGAVSQPITLVIEEAPAVDNRPAGFQFVNHAFHIVAYQGNSPLANFHFAQPITLVVEYTDEQIAGLDELKLTFYYFDETTGQWSDSGITVIERDTVNNRLVVQIPHLTTFALFASALTAAPTPKSILYLPLIGRSGFKPGQNAYCGGHYCIEAE